MSSVQAHEETPESVAQRLMQTRLPARPCMTLAAGAKRRRRRPGRPAYRGRCQTARRSRPGACTTSPMPAPNTLRNNCSSTFIFPWRTENTNTHARQQQTRRAAASVSQPMAAGLPLARHARPRPEPGQPVSSQPAGAAASRAGQRPAVVPERARKAPRAGPGVLGGGLHAAGFSDPGAFARAELQRTRAIWCRSDAHGCGLGHVGPHRPAGQPPGRHRRAARPARVAGRAPAACGSAGRNTC